MKNKEKAVKKQKPVKLGKPPKKTKTITEKINKDDLEYEVNLRRCFLWVKTDEKEINDKKVKVTFERGANTCNSKKGLKLVKFYEKSYRQLLHKRFPLGFIICLLLFGGAFAGSFLTKEYPLIQIAMIVLYAIFAGLSFFALLVYIITMIRKKKMLAFCLSESKKFDLNPIELSTSDEEVNSPVEEVDIQEGYLQGNSKDNIG